MEYSIAIYSIGEAIYILPISRINDGPSILTEPLISASINDHSEILAQKMVSTFENCRILQERPDPGIFKKFLRISKARSNKNLVNMAISFSAQLDYPVLTLTPLESAPKIKSFIGSKNIQPIIINLHEYSNEKIGDLLKELIKKYKRP